MLERLQEQVRAAVAARTPLHIRAGGSKDFYGNQIHGELLDPRGCAGIVAHEPTELVITARCGTRLAELEAALDAAGQMLPFEPPHFGPAATVGGCVAAGLCGPRRASAGAVRDYLLGARLLTGGGEVLAFGGTVMKNVAGYDVARLAAGSLGTLGVITEVSLKVLPKPVAEATLRLEFDEVEALRKMNEWAGQPLPVSATAWRDGVLHVRLSGARAAVAEAQRKIGGSAIDGAALWHGLREQTDAYFAGDAPLWRLAVPSTAEPLALTGAQLIEWGGGQRWLRSDAPASEIRARAAACGGHATLFRGGERRHVFTPLPLPVEAIHKRLKAEFDPAGIFNPGRMYEW
ncbi:MAG: glycolate oxidase subunit GlcE [Burkholderiales bacterium]|nr:glycolate oxidase subunit GlcE [Burkholderiales bacterium]